MRKTREFQVKKEVLIKIGERVFIDDVEWKAAEVIDDIVTLYREGIGVKVTPFKRQSTKLKLLFLKSFEIENESIIKRFILID